MKESESLTPEGVKYKYFHCENCGDEILDMKQLEEVAQKYRLLEKYPVRLSKWGQSLGLRIPKVLAEKYHLKPNEEIFLIPEKSSLKLISH